MHTRDALKKGEDPDRIAVLPAWEETDYFSEIRAGGREIPRTTRCGWRCRGLVELL
jgi:hypothetical protein